MRRFFTRKTDKAFLAALSRRFSIFDGITFYQSTGNNSGAGGTWFPTMGVVQRKSSISVEGYQAPEAIFETREYRPNLVLKPMPHILVSMFLPEDEHRVHSYELQQYFEHLPHAAEAVLQAMNEAGIANGIVLDKAGPDTPNRQRCFWVEDGRLKAPWPIYLTSEFPAEDEFEESLERFYQNKGLQACDGIPTQSPMLLRHPFSLMRKYQAMKVYLYQDYLNAMVVHSFGSDADRYDRLTQRLVNPRLAALSAALGSEVWETTGGKNLSRWLQKLYPEYFDRRYRFIEDVGFSKTHILYAADASTNKWIQTHQGYLWDEKPGTLLKLIDDRRMVVLDGMFWGEDRSQLVSGGLSADTVKSLESIFQSLFRHNVELLVSYLHDMLVKSTLVIPSEHGRTSYSALLRQSLEEHSAKARMNPQAEQQERVSTKLIWLKDYFKNPEALIPFKALVASLPMVELMDIVQGIQEHLKLHASHSPRKLADLDTLKSNTEARFKYFLAKLHLS
ncbi:MAG: hypothetical protein V4490_05195 [Pseudomonadota bacterium]